MTEAQYQIEHRGQNTANLIDPKMNADAQVGNTSNRESSRQVACIELLNQWLADESGYDEAVWPKVKETLEASLASNRLPFDE